MWSCFPPRCADSRTVISAGRFRSEEHPLRPGGTGHGTGRLPGLEGYGRLPLEHLDRFNQRVRETAGASPSVLLADVHRRFLGHGVTASEEERWYWRRNMIEPNARGASEIRRVWWELLEDIA